MLAELETAAGDLLMTMFNLVEAFFLCTAVVDGLQSSTSALAFIEFIITNTGVI